MSDRAVKPPTTYGEQLKILSDRNLMIPSQIKALEVLEKINYYIAHALGPLGYMESAHFINEKYHHDFMNELSKDLRRRRRNELFVTHYEDFYGAKYPIWLAIEVTTFSQLSKLFRNLKNEHKSAIAKEHYQIPYTYIQNWLQAFSELRNVCAHYGRLYNKKLAVKLLLTSKDLRLVNNEKVFGVIFVLRKMILSKNEWLSFKIKLEALVEEYTDVIELNRIGFPPNWRELLR